METIQPDYFKYAELNFDSSQNRKKWLKEQIALTDQSLRGYQAEIVDLFNSLSERGVNVDELGGISISNSGTFVATSIAGTVLATIPTGITQVIGGLLMVGNAVFSKLEKKAKEKWALHIIAVAQAKLAEAEQVAAYAKRYKNELLFLQVLPFVLALILILLMK